MPSKVSRPRSVVGLVLVGLLAGPLSLMLWLGRWKAALAYLAAGIAITVAYFAFAVRGHDALAILGFYRPTRVALILIVLGTVAGLVHGLLVRSHGMRRSWYSRWYVALPLPIVAGLSAAFMVRTFLFQPFNSTAISMAPNVMVGDYFLVSKTAYVGGSQLQRGDIAVFVLPANPNNTYVSRIAGGPGDRIRMTNGVLQINGTAVTLEAVELAPELYRIDPTDPNGEAPQYFREKLPDGRSYVIANIIDTGAADNTDEFLVPEGHYFVLGDNRDNAPDSRYPNTVGYVPEENFIGPVVLKFWNSRGFNLADRPEEIYPK